MRLCSSTASNVIPVLRGTSKLGILDPISASIHVLGVSLVPSYMLDTNVYDYLLNNAVPLDLVSRCGAIFITNVQLSEVQNIPNHERRAALLMLIEQLGPQKLQLKSGIWLDELRWDDQQVWIDEVSSDFGELLGQATRNLPRMDALIAEVALHKGLILVTSDTKFASRAQKCGIRCVTPESIFS